MPANQDIATVQQLLLNHGFDVGKAGADGVWGSDTQRALVAALQSAMAAPPVDPDLDDPAAVAEYRADEGWKAYAYQDSEGWWTIGCGRLVDQRKQVGLTDPEILFLLQNRRVQARHELDTHLPWWRGQTPARKRALENLIYNMGWGTGDHGLSSFRNTLAAWEAGDYERAAVGLAASAWAKQVQASRRDRILRQVRTGQ